MAAPTSPTGSVTPTPSQHLYTDTSGGSSSIIGLPAAPRNLHFLPQKRLNDETKIKLWKLINIIAIISTAVFIIVELTKPSEFLSTFEFGALVTFALIALFTKVLGMQNTQMNRTLEIDSPV